MVGKDFASVNQAQEVCLCSFAPYNAMVTREDKVILEVTMPRPLRALKKRY